MFKTKDHVRNHICYSYYIEYITVIHLNFGKGRTYDLYSYFICDKCSKFHMKTLATNDTKTKIFKVHRVKV